MSLNFLFVSLKCLWWQGWRYCYSLRLKWHMFKHGTVAERSQATPLRSEQSSCGMGAASRYAEAGDLGCRTTLHNPWSGR